MILTEVSLKRPVFATVMILALVTLGLASYFTLPIEEWPSVEFPYVTVVVPYKGASPEQVDSKIVQRVEEAVSSVSGVKHITSIAKEGVATTTIEFTLETSPTVAAQDVRDKIGKIRGDLPTDCDEPVIMRFDPTEQPIASIVVTGDLSVREMTTLIDDVIKRRLETINGVGSINVQGALEREIHVDLHKDQLTAHGLTIPEIVEHLQSENLEIPGGKLTNGDREVNVRTAGNYALAQNFLNTPIARRDGIELYVRDIAEVADTTEEPTKITRLDGQPGVGLDIMKQSGANTVEVADQIKAATAKLQSELPANVKLTIVRDNSLWIRDAVADVVHNLIIGGCLAVAIVFLFLGNWRSTLISAIAIPASIISTFWAMKLFDFTVNTMSLLALSLAVGLLIDDAIVVIENIVRHMERGEDKYTAALEGAKEIGLAVTATTLTLVAVFVPVGMMTGIVGRFFKQFGITVAFAVLVSLFIAFTLTPMLSASFLDVSHGQGKHWLGRLITRFNTWFDAVTDWYSAKLGQILQHGRLAVVIISVLLFAGSLALTPLLGSSFIPRADNGEFTILVDVDPGASVEGANKLAMQMDQVIRTAPEVQTVYSQADIDQIKMYVRIGDKNSRSRSVDTIIRDLRQQLNALPGVKVSFLQKNGVTEQKPVELSVRGESMDAVSDIAEQVQRAMDHTPGAVDVVSSFKPGKPDVQISIRQDVAADLAIATGTVADTLRTLFNGMVVGQFKDGDDQYDVRLRLAPEDRTGIQDLSGIFLPARYKNPQGMPIAMAPLSQVTETTYATSPSEVRRYDRMKEIRLSSNLDGTSLGKFDQAVAKNLANVDRPAGYMISPVGEAERMGESFNSILGALVLAVLFIFFVLSAQFESYVDPLAIMLSLPLAIIGAILGLLAARSDLSIVSLIGVIMLMGLVTKNAILMIDFTKQRREEGRGRNEALVEAARIRMRPIIMTTAAMIFGMIPLALGLGPGAEVRAPMAHAIVGGLITSTLLTLVVVPVIYTYFDDLKTWFHLKKNPSVHFNE